MAFNFTVVESDIGGYTVDNGIGGTFYIPKMVLDYLINGGGFTEQQYSIYEMARCLHRQNVDLNNYVAVIEAINNLVLD